MPINRLHITLGITCALVSASALAQSSSDTANDAQATTTNSAISQNWQFITHPPVAPIAASMPAATRRGRGGGRGRRQASADSDIAPDPGVAAQTPQTPLAPQPQAQ